MKELRGVKPKITPDRDPLTKAPPAPKWMTPEAQAEWKRIMPDLIARRIITKADMGLVEIYCIAAGRVREIEQQFRTTGTVDKVLFGMQNRAMQTARQLGELLGLSPVSRARIGSAAPDDDDGDVNPLKIGRNRTHG